MTVLDSPIPRFHLAMPVDDLAAAREFYGEVLGLPQGRSAATWNSRGGSAAVRFDYLYEPEELVGWVDPLRELAAGAEQAYAYFNNNNQTNGVAQAPAGAELLRRILEEHEVATG